MTILKRIFFQAVWHPMEDIIIVGRYPDDKVQTGDTRTIDFYDGATGQLLHNIASPSQNIVSVRINFLSNSLQYLSKILLLVKLLIYSKFRELFRL